MKIFIVILLGIATSILIHGHWLLIDNWLPAESKHWTNILIQSSVFEYFSKNYHEGWSYALISFWFRIPLLLPLTVILAVVVDRLNQQRVFCYSVLATTAFVFIVLPKLPIFNILLDDSTNYTNLILNRITPLFLFLMLFYFSTLAIKKYTKSTKQDG